MAQVMCVYTHRRPTCELINSLNNTADQNGEISRDIWLQADTYYTCRKWPEISMDCIHKPQRMTYSPISTWIFFFSILMHIVIHLYIVYCNTTTIINYKTILEQFISFRLHHLIIALVIPLCDGKMYKDWYWDTGVYPKSAPLFTLLCSR